MDIVLEPLPIKVNDTEIDCQKCKAKMMKSALFCGNCGYSISNNNIDAFTKDLGRNHPESEAVWHWISPALKLWGFLLFTIALVGSPKQVVNPPTGRSTRRSIWLRQVSQCRIRGDAGTH